MRILQILRHAVVIVPVSILLCAIAPACAGQVVSDALQTWARQSVQNEASLAAEAPANTVAVLYFHNLTGRPDLDPLQKGMALMLITDLAKIERLQVVERIQLQALARELDLGVSGLVDADSAPRMGRLLGARHLVGGVLSDLPTDAFRIDASVLNVPRDARLGDPASSGTLDELIRMEKEILFEVVRLLDLELTDAEREELRKPIARDVRALLFLFEGIHSSDQGDYDQAAQHYHKALELEPGLPAAESALDELIGLKLIRPLPDTEALLRQIHEQVSVNTGPGPSRITRRHHSEPASVLGPASPGTADIQVQW
jgi:TolB-like protein